MTVTTNLPGGTRTRRLTIHLNRHQARKKVAVTTTVTAGVLTGKSELAITTVAGLLDVLYDAEIRDSDGGTWRRLGGNLVAQDGVRGQFDLDDPGDATMVMLCAPFRVAADAVCAYRQFIVQHTTGGRHQVVPVDPAFNMKPVEGGADLESFEEAAALRDRLNAEAAAALATRRTGRRRTDRAQLPEWLDAPLLDDEDPRDGDLLDPQDAGVGDYLFEFHDSTGTASWLRILAPVAVVDGAALVTCGRGSGVTLPVPVGRQVWVLRRVEAAALASAAFDRVLRPWGGREDGMERLLRSFESRNALIKGWPFGALGLADALTAWDLLREADAANTTDVPPTVGAVAR